jgi:hypothetical protein
MNCHADLGGLDRVLDVDEFRIGARKAQHAKGYDE